MDSKAPRPQKVAQQPLPPVSPPETIPTENKYARQRRVGASTRKDLVSSVGLGKLEVITHYAKHPDL